MGMTVRGCGVMCLFVLSGTWALILRAVSPLAVNRTWWSKAARLHTVRRRGGHKGNRLAIGATRCASYGHRPRDIVDILPQRRVVATANTLILHQATSPPRGAIISVE